MTHLRDRSLRRERDVQKKDRYRDTQTGKWVGRMTDGRRGKKKIKVCASSDMLYEPEQKKNNMESRPT